MTDLSDLLIVKNLIDECAIEWSCKQRVFFAILLLNTFLLFVKKNF